MRTWKEAEQIILKAPEAFRMIQFRGRLNVCRSPDGTLQAARDAAVDAMIKFPMRGALIYAVRGVEATVFETINWSKRMTKHLITLGAQNAVTHAKFPTDEAANEYTAPDGTTFPIANEEELAAKLSCDQLINLHNSFGIGDPVKAFHDKATAARRCWSLMNLDITQAKEADMAKAKTTKKTKTPKQAKVKVPKVTGAGRGRAAKFAGDAKITILSDGNPLRKGGAAYDRFELIRNGMLVSTALEKGVWRADLNWCTKKGFIKID